MSTRIMTRAMLETNNEEGTKFVKHEAWLRARSRRVGSGNTVIELSPKLGDSVRGWDNDQGGAR